MALDMRQKLKIALIIMCVVALGALSYSWIVSRESDACGPDWGHVSVHIKDSYGNALRNVNVTIWAGSELVRSDLTDGTGEASFGHLPFRCYNLTLEKKGCNFQYLYFCLNESSSRLKLYLTLLYSCFDLILNITNVESGLPILNASVKVYRYDYADTYQEWNNITGSSGVVNFSALEYDEYAIVVSHVDYFKYTALVFMDENMEYLVTLQEIPSPEPDPEPDPDPKPEWMDLAIGIVIGFIVVSGIAFFLLQRRFGDEDLTKWK